MTTTEEVMCPKCGGRTWDNRDTKTNPKAPDYKCRDRGCDGVVWPPKGAKNGAGNRVAAAAAPPVSLGGPLPYETPAPVRTAIPSPDRLAVQFETYAKCLDRARLELLRAGIDQMGGDVAGAVVAAAATLYIQAQKP